MTDPMDATPDSRSQTEIRYLLRRLKHCSVLLDMTSVAVYVLTTFHIAFVFYVLLSLDYDREFFYRRSSDPSFMNTTQVALIFFIVTTIFIRDRFIGRGDDLFQLISDRLESSQSKEGLNTNPSEADSSDDSSAPLRDEFTQTEIRLLLRRFVSLTHLPLFRKSDSGEFIYLSFNFILGFGIAILRILLVSPLR